jgi:cytochrome c oxidase cbb3-type subunit 3
MTRTGIHCTRARFAMRPALAALAATLAAVTGCAGGDSEPLPPAAMAQQRTPVVTSDLRAGAAPASAPARNPYAQDEHALTAGRELYTAMNCAGCHGPAGGGGIGPPLADADWIYGGQPENVVQSILQGRPNGMPAFGPKLPASEAWKIATYVEQLSKKAAGKGESPAIGSAKGTSTGGGR